MKALYAGVFAAALVTSSSSSANYVGSPNPAPSSPKQSPPSLPPPIAPLFPLPPLDLSKIQPPPAGPAFEQASPLPPCAFCSSGLDPTENPGSDLQTYEELNPNVDKLPPWEAYTTEPVD
jgi:hypothetical protein